MLMAAGLGFEPRYYAPEAYVLPLDDPAKRTSRFYQIKAKDSIYIAGESQIL